MFDYKFRGKNKFSEWYYGDYVGPCTSCFETYIQGRETFVFGDDKQHSPEGLHEVMYHTIGQYIGHKDINNREIYEGDILKVVDSNWGYGGEYDIIHDGYKYFVVPTIQEFINGDVDKIYFANCEVVGNKYDNYDLIKEEIHE